MKMTTASKVTCARILLVPAFAALLVSYFKCGKEADRLAGILCFALAAVGDAVDGYIARRYNQRSDLGSILDPLADKLLLVTGLVLLSLDTRQLLSRIPWWLPAIVVTRDLVLLAGSIAIYRACGKLTARPRLPGKVSTVLQMTIVLWVLLRFPAPWLPCLTIGAGLFTILSGILYLHDFTLLWRSRKAPMDAQRGATLAIRRN